MTLEYVNYILSCFQTTSEYPLTILTIEMTLENVDGVIRQPIHKIHCSSWQRSHETQFIIACFNEYILHSSIVTDNTYTIHIIFTIHTGIIHLLYWRQFFPILLSLFV